jgi:fibronectin type 3 domain-containing protein
MKTIVISILLSVFAQAADVRLRWNPNPVEDAVVRYEVSYHTGPDTPVVTHPATETRLTVPELVPGTTYYFTVTAVNDEGLKSEPSDVLAYRVPKPILKPSGLEVIED